MTFVALNNLGSGFLIRAYDLTQVFRVEFAREVGGTDEITKHHGELAAFGLACTTGGLGWNGETVLRSIGGE